MTVPSSLCQQEAVTPRKESFCDRKGAPSFGFHSAKVPEVPVQEGILTADQLPAVGVHPALQDRQCRVICWDFVFPELQIPDPADQGD